MQEPNVIFIAPCQLAFVRMTGPYPTSSLDAWKVILDWLAERKHEVIGTVGYGLALDDPRSTPPDALRYDACIRTPPAFDSEIDRAIRLQQFTGGAYFTTRRIGCYSALGKVVSEARDVMLPRQGLIHDFSRPVMTMNYSYPSETPPGQQVADVCIPVVPDRRLAPRP